MNEAPGLTRGERRRSLAAIITTIAVYGVTLGLTSPLISLILESRGVERAIIGMNAAVPALAVLLVSPLVPRMIRALGYRRVIAFALVVEVAVLLLFPALDDLAVWFVLRFVLGASGALLFIAAESWINQLAEDTTRGRVVSMYVMAASAGLALGPVIIGFAGIEGWPPFLIGAGVILASIVPLLLAGDTAPAIERGSSFGVLGFVKQAPTLAGAVMLFAFVIMTQFSLLPVYGVQLGMDDGAAARLLVVLTLGNVVLQIAIGWALDRYDRYLVLLFCGLSVVAGSLLLPLAVHHGAWLWPLLFFWGGLGSGVYTVAMTLLGQRFRGADLVTANAAFSVLWGIAHLAGPPTAGWAMDVWNPEGLPGTLALAGLAFVLLWCARQWGPWRRPKA